MNNPVNILQVFAGLMFIFYMALYCFDFSEPLQRMIVGTVCMVSWGASAHLVNVVDAATGFILAYLYYGFAAVCAVLVLSDSFGIFERKFKDWF